ncbi:hypothetical protein QBC35DRAFT_355502, partial [Podospora australis]
RLREMRKERRLLLQEKRNLQDGLDLAWKNLRIFAHVKDELLRELDKTSLEAQEDKKRGQAATKALEDSKLAFEAELQTLKSTHQQEIRDLRDKLTHEVEKRDHIQKAYGKQLSVHQTEQSLMRQRLKDQQALQTRQFEEELEQQVMQITNKAEEDRIVHELALREKILKHEQDRKDLQEVMEGRQYQLKENARQQRERYHAEIERLQSSTNIQLAEYRTELETLQHELKSKFHDLNLAIEVVTEPINLGDIALPQGSQLDLYRVLERDGMGAIRFLLRSIIWDEVMDGFFSAPFGFGVLGSGHGRNRLFQLYSSWRRVLDEDDATSAAETAQPDFDLFQRDQHANLWRCATFSSIRSMIAECDDGNRKETISLYITNKSKVKQDVLNVLSSVTSTVPDGVKRKVDDIVDLAGDLALEAGVHDAHLGLGFPSKGDSVQIRHGFVDCEDEDAIDEVVEEVELVVCPYFYCIGDGNGNFSTLRPIVQGKI